MKRRVILIVLDGCGIGDAPDAEAFGDLGANTLLHVAEQAGSFNLPNLQRLGLGNIFPLNARLPGVPAVTEPVGAPGRMYEQSMGKDTTTGHWELAGAIVDKPFATFPNGFPAEIIGKFKSGTGLDPIGNVAASGTEILKSLGEEHLRTGRPIIYTSADSVLQIAAHEDIIPVEELYEICKKTLNLMTPYRVARVIARPFIGDSTNNFQRTIRRHDFSITPPAETVLDRLVSEGLSVHGVGKINDIFTGRGISSYITTKNNQDGIDKTIEALQDIEQGLVFTNLVDFDMLYGHRLDSNGFSRALTEFDLRLPELMDQMTPHDLLLITADHGCDPTVSGTDHTRESVPLIAWNSQMEKGIDLGIRSSFADISATVAEFFNINWSPGCSFWQDLS